MILNYTDIKLNHGEQTILSGVNLCVDPGDFVFITGKVGSGKSTLLSTIYGELKPSSGQAIVLDYNLQQLKTKDIPTLRKQLGIVFQSFELLNDCDVWHNMEFVLRATGWKSKSEINLRIQQVLSKVNMADKGEKYPYQLSGGEQQRVSIARAILNSPKLIIADEPTGNLDSDSSASIIRLLDDIRDEGTAIIMSTHNLGLISLVKNPKVFCCSEGQLREEADNKMKN